MPAFIDGHCPKCGKRFGWQGEVTDRPPCPKCGHQIPKKELEAAQRQLEKDREAILKKFNREEERGETTPDNG